MSNFLSIVQFGFLIEFRLSSELSYNAALVKNLKIELETEFKGRNYFSSIW